MHEIMDHVKYMTNKGHFTEFEIELNSSVVAAYAYNPELEELAVLFNSGNLYTYYGVSEKTYWDFWMSESQGKFFNKHIRDNYDYGKRLIIG